MVGRGWPARLSLAGAFVLATACGGGDGGGTVDVTLQEFSVIPAQDSVEAGEVTFEAENTGPDDPHELVVISTDLAPDALPTTEDGAVDEEGEGIEVVGEIEEFPPGETRSASFDLEAGSYVLICNVTEKEDGEIEAHYSQGMRAALTVTEG
jgi:uncharacterized cupredoxin-like copper-binding protein